LTFRENDISSSDIVIIAFFDPMPRTIIDIPAEQLLEVDRICRALNISRAEGVRRALHAFVREHEDIQHEGFGLWQGARTSGAELARSLRKHW
jgi:hypothetical protein